MPVYDISDRDLEDLLAYLKLLGETLDPGLSDTAIRIGTLLPSEGPLGAIGNVIRGVLEAYFQEVNQAGGIYGRRLELSVHEIGTDEVSVSEAVKAWLGDEQPFALVSPFTPRMDFEVQSAVSSENVPLVGPFTLYPIESFSLNRNVFYLYPGLAEQVRALLEFAAAQLELTDPKVALVYPDDGSHDGVIAAAETACRDQGWPLRKEPYPVGGFEAASTAGRLHEAGVDVVLSLGVESELRSFLEAAASRHWTPYVLAQGVLSGSLIFDAPETFKQRLYLAYPSLPQDRKDWAIRELSKLLKDRAVARSHTQALVSAYASAKILVEALRRAGKQLGRQELTAELEKFYQFETGLTPPITYTRNRRMGAKGAYITGPGAVIDRRLPESVEWVDVK